MLLKVVLKQNLWAENIIKQEEYKAFGNQIVGKIRKHFKCKIFRETKHICS